MLVLPGPIAIFAVDDPGLRRMKLQTAPLEPAVNGCQHLLGLHLALAMDDNVVSVTLERDRDRISCGGQWRPTHHTDVTLIDADSYRRSESEAEAAARRKRKP